MMSKLYEVVKSSLMKLKAVVVLLKINKRNIAFQNNSNNLF